MQMPRSCRLLCSLGIYTWVALVPEVKDSGGEDERLNLNFCQCVSDMG